MKNNKLIQCSFCEKTQDEVHCLVASNDEKSFICNKCIMISVNALIRDMLNTNEKLKKDYMNQLLEIIKYTLSN